MVSSFVFDSKRMQDLVELYHANRIRLFEVQPHGLECVMPAALNARHEKIDWQLLLVGLHGFCCRTERPRCVDDIRTQCGVLERREIDMCWVLGRWSSVLHRRTSNENDKEQSKANQGQRQEESMFVMTKPEG